jgi:hypothetical protein
MGYFSQLATDIITLHYDGMAIEDIASLLKIDYVTVEEIVNAYDDGSYDADPGEMDGDFDSAMTSAGFGTDEDYGYYGDE